MGDYEICLLNTFIDYLDILEEFHIIEGSMGKKDCEIERIVFAGVLTILNNKGDWK